MEFDFSQIITMLDGTPATDEKTRVLTLGVVVANTLTGHNPSSNLDLIKRLTLAEKVYDGGKADIDDADAQAIRDALKAGPYIALVLAKAIRMITPVGMVPSTDKVIKKLEGKK